MGQGVQSVEADERVKVQINDQRLESDVALAAIGLKPQVSLAASAGLDVGVGVIVNQYGQTSNPDIYALGDCAEVCGLLRFYVAPLRICAQAVAKNILGVEEKIHYQPMPVMMKTPSYPICFCFKDRPEDWQVNAYDDGIAALAYEGEQLVGFALSGSQMSQRMELKKQMVDWL